MQPATEDAVRATLAALRAEIGVKTPAQVEAWDWSEDVAMHFVLDEGDEERIDAGKSLRAYMAGDIAYRLGVQLQEMAKDLHPDERREGMKIARAGDTLAARLRAIAQSSN